jgi:hypothetical protein
MTKHKATEIHKAFRQYMDEGYTVSPYKQGEGANHEVGFSCTNITAPSVKFVAYTGTSFQEADEMFNILCLFYDGFCMGRCWEREQEMLRLRDEDEKTPQQ